MEAFLSRDHEIAVRAVHTRSERLKDSVSQAYKEKYNTPGSIQYVKDMSRKKSEKRQRNWFRSSVE